MTTDAADDVTGPSPVDGVDGEPVLLVDFDRDLERAAPPLARTTLERAAHRRRDPAWLEQAWSQARVLVVDVAAGGRALVAGDDEPSLLLLDSVTVPQTGPAERLFLGVEADGVAVFAVDAALSAVDGARPLTVRDVGHALSARDAGLFTTAAALAHWHASHRYSPVSGKPTTVADGGWVRVDPDGRQMWPRTDPAMIVLVHDGVPGPSGRCLLGHNVAWGRSAPVRRFSCLAGFVEPGESAEAAVSREVAEEVGVRVDTIRYRGSQAWPFPGSLMLGFTARADAGEPVRVDPDEIADARWFTRRQVAAMVAAGFPNGIDLGLPDSDGVPVGLPMPASIAYFLIDGWLAGG